MKCGDSSKAKSTGLRPVGVYRCRVQFSGQIHSTMEQVLALLLILASASYALRVYGDYDEYNQGHEEGDSGHWSSQQSDQAEKGQGEKQYHQHYFGNSGEEAEGIKKSGGHYKHHVTKGYQNYHHKDEVGKTTSYVDTNEDSGDHYGNHGGERTWGDHGHSGNHRDQYITGYSGQKGSSEFNAKQKKGSISKKNERKESYKGDIADILYAKKPATYSTEFQSRGLFPSLPYPYYFY